MDRLRVAAGGGEAGLTLLELLIAGCILCVGTCALVVVVIHSMILATMNSETARAQEAARSILERVTSVPPEHAFALFNQVTGDDPADLEAPGGRFEIGGTEEAAAITGEIIFPVGTDGASLREDVVDPHLGMPWDLNGDGVIDSANHADDYVLLPVRIRVTWNGVSGERSFDLAATLRRE